MNRGFYTILAAQFFSALADNALLFAAVALLKDLHAPSWQTPVLQVFFVFSYIVLAPFVGPLADAIPKGRVMFIGNAVKVIGCLCMLFGLHPLLAYGVVGVGAAMYSPAKYGILTEYLPPHKLVWANGWMEGLTVAAIILGARSWADFWSAASSSISPRRISPTCAITAGSPPHRRMPCWPCSASTSSLPIVNLYIPRVALDHKLPKKTPLYILQDFWHCLILLWRDPLGQVSLAVTTLFWGAGATLRLIVLEWAGPALGFTSVQGHSAHGRYRGRRCHRSRCSQRSSWRCTARCACFRSEYSWASG